MTRAALWVLVGQVLDAATFVAFYALIPAAILAAIGVVERNPLMLALYLTGGFGAVVGIKLAVPLLIVWLDSGRTTPRRRRLTVFMVVMGATGYIGAASNLIALATVMAALG
jgi:hypothetical protein